MNTELIKIIIKHARPTKKHNLPLVFRLVTNFIEGKKYSFGALESFTEIISNLEKRWIKK